jgi:hypothetical protein
MTIVFALRQFLDLSYYLRLHLRGCPYDFTTREPFPRKQPVLLEAPVLLLQSASSSWDASCYKERRYHNGKRCTGPWPASDERTHTHAFHLFYEAQDNIPNALDPNYDKPNTTRLLCTGTSN